MERKSGFKECPRCGLRNKLAAPQCDFCGWEFHGASEDWAAQVKALDRIGHDVDSVVLDDELSKKIESTIVRIPRESSTPSKPVLTIEEISTTESAASNEVVICLKCNELVNESVDSCPSCGARFDRT